MRLSDWIVPPKFKWLIFHVLGWNIVVVSEGPGEQKFFRGLPNLPFFQGSQTKPFLGKLNGEFRPTVIVDGLVKLIIKSDQLIERLRVGVGVRPNHHAKTVRFQINGQNRGELTNLEAVDRCPPSGEWQDLDLSLSAVSREIELEVTAPDSEIYLSYPLPFFTRQSDSSPSRKNIIVIVLDAVSYRFLTRMPRTQDFFRSGINCSQVFTQGYWTLPAFSSLITGLYPSRHGVNPPRGDTFLDEDMAVLPDLLRQAGFRTFGYSSHKRFAPIYGHAKGFERFIFRPLDYKNYISLSLGEAIEQLATHRDESNFVLLHVFDTHPPFEPALYYQNSKRSTNRLINTQRKKFENDFERRDYDDLLIAKLASIDLALSSLYDYVKREGQEETVVILTADHGIIPGTVGKPLLLEDNTRIPLLVRGPGMAPIEVSDLIEGSVDFFPSILRLAGLPLPSGIDGRPWPFLGGERREQALSESLYPGEYQAALRDRRTVTHFTCPLDLTARKLQFGARRVLSYFRKSGADQEDQSIINSDFLDSKTEFLRQHLKKALNLELLE